MAITTSAKRYGLGEPLVTYSDDPVKDKQMLYATFNSSLAENLTPMATAPGLESLSLPMELEVVQLDSPRLIQDAFTSLIGPLDNDNSAHICASLNAEWKSRHVGVLILQIAPHSQPNTIYIIPIHRFQKLPASFLRFLISKQVFLIGSSFHADQEAIQAVGGPNLQ
ncbi:hypothetical protein B0H14DRAFT_2574453 [Mycena olivaceomarginata]|nr:hypothetical protein B0H14DRAFT_2574453 [Mycena olivaceomarginata]